MLCSCFDVVSADSALSCSVARDLQLLRPDKREAVVRVADSSKRSAMLHKNISRHTFCSSFCSLVIIQRDVR